MPIREHEAIAVGPVRVGRVVLHDPAVQHMGEGSERHRRPLMAAVGRQRGVHREPTHEIDDLTILFFGE